MGLDESEVVGHPVDRFFAAVDAIPHEIYPTELAPVAGRHIEGVAGFPAGRGLYADCGWDHAQPPPFPFRGVMLVGHHLDSEEAYLQKLAAGEANGDPCPGASRMRFWTMLYALLDLAEVPRTHIFVTNIYPALLRGDSATGAVRATAAWTDACRTVLSEQIAVMRPRAIAAMGAPAQAFISELLAVSWTSVPDTIELEVGGRPTAVLALRHPSAAQSRENQRRTADLLRDP